MIEARIALEKIYFRRRGYLIGLSDEFNSSQAVCGLLLPSRIELDRMIATELGIHGKRASERDVSRNGGYGRDTYEWMISQNP